MSKKFWILVLLASIAWGYFTHKPSLPSAVQTDSTPTPSPAQIAPSTTPSSVRNIETENGGTIQIRTGH